MSRNCFFSCINMPFVWAECHLVRMWGWPSCRISKNIECRNTIKSYIIYSLHLTEKVIEDPKRKIIHLLTNQLQYPTVSHYLFCCFFFLNLRTIDSHSYVTLHSKCSVQINIVFPNLHSVLLFFHP